MGDFVEVNGMESEYRGVVTKIDDNILTVLITYPNSGGTCEKKLNARGCHIEPFEFSIKVLAKGMFHKKKEIIEEEKA
jgi:hypothetical protein